MNTLKYFLLGAILVLGSMGRSQAASIMLVPGIYAPDYSAYCQPRTIFRPNGLSVGGFWVVAFLDGAAAAGVSEFSCYIEGLEALPPFWDVQVTAVFPGVVTGDFASYRFVDFRYERGGTVTFADCQAKSSSLGSFFPLLQVHLVGVGATQDVAENTRVRIVHAVPWGPVEQACALLSLCESGAFTKVCVNAEELIVNAQPPICKGLPANETTWSNVKALFR